MTPPERASTDVQGILPARPLRARPPLKDLWDSFSLILLFIFGCFVAYMVKQVAPDLYTDWQVRDTAVPIVGGRWSNGTCAKQLLISMCNLTLSAPSGTGQITRTVHYAFGGYPASNLAARVVGDPQRPDWLTTDLGLDYFWSRLVTLLLSFAPMALQLWYVIEVARRAARARAAWDRADVVPVPLRLLEAQDAASGAAWTLQAENGRTVRWEVPRGMKPFVLGPAADRVLGLMVCGDGSIMPLDAGLYWVELSDQERTMAVARAFVRADG